MQTFLKMTVLMAGALLLAAPVLAADGQFAIGGNLGYATLTGDDFQAADDGFGVNGSLRYNMVNGFGINGAVQWNSHDVKGTDESFNMLRIGVEPRYNFSLSNPVFTPYLGARAMWIRESADNNMSANGWGFGATGGMIFQTSPNFGIELGLSYDAISFGDIKVDGNTLENSDTSGGSFSIMTGIVYSFSK